MGKRGGIRTKGKGRKYIVRNVNFDEFIDEKNTNRNNAPKRGHPDVIHEKDLPDFCKSFFKEETRNEKRKKSETSLIDMASTEQSEKRRRPVEPLVKKRTKPELPSKQLLEKEEFKMQPTETLRGYCRRMDKYAFDAARSGIKKVVTEHRRNKTRSRREAAEQKEAGKLERKKIRIDDVLQPEKPAFGDVVLCPPKLAKFSKGIKVPSH